MARIADCEKENVSLKIEGDKRIDEEKRKLLEEVEEIRKREEKLEVEIQQKIEEEIVRMQKDQELEMQSGFIEYLWRILRLSQNERD
jgi:hypothetical protein